MAEMLASALQECNQLQAKVVAIPALYTGNGGFTDELAAKVLIQAVVTFLGDTPTTSIDEVILIQRGDEIHATYRAVYTQMQQEAAVLAQVEEASIKRVHSIVINDVSLEILSGDIEQVECEGCVLVSPAEEVEGHKMIMDSLFDDSFQSHNSSRHSTAMGDTFSQEVRVVKLPQKKMLKCRQVLQVPSPTSLEDSEQTILNILLTAEREKLESVAFPASMLRSTGYSLVQEVESVYGIIMAFIKEKEQHLVKSISVVIPDSEGKRRNSRKSTSAPDQR